MKSIAQSKSFGYYSSASSKKGGVGFDRSNRRWTDTATINLLGGFFVPTRCSVLARLAGGRNPRRSFVRSINLLNAPFLFDRKNGVYPSPNEGETPMSKVTPRSKSPSLDSLTTHALDARMRRFMNHEYERGFMEGQHEAAIALSSLVDSILQKYNHIASVDVVRCEK